MRGFGSAGKRRIACRQCVMWRKSLHRGGLRAVRGGGGTVNRR